MGESTFPGTLNTFRDEWPLVRPGDGIVDDFLGDAYTVTPSGSSPTVTVSTGAAGRAKCRVAGFAHVFDAPVVLSLTGVSGATEPTGTQKRVDLIVVRYSWSQANLNIAATLAVRAGSPTAASTPLLDAAPPPVQVAGSTWEVPIAAVSRVAGGVVSAKVDLRPWAHNEQYLGDATPGVPLVAAPLGSVRQVGVTTWRRVLGEDRAPTWRPDQVEGNVVAYGEGAANIASGGTETIAIVGMTGANSPQRGVLFCTVNIDVSAGNGSAGWIWILTSGATEWSKQRWQFDGPQNGLVSFFFMAPIRSAAGGVPAGINLQVRASVDPAGTAVLFARAKVMVGNFTLGVE